MTKPWICWQIGAYGYKSRMKAFSAGCVKLGGKVMDIRHATQSSMDANKRLGAPIFAFTCGMHRAEARARLYCKENNIPLLVLDLGYFKRAAGSADTVGYNQIGINKLCWVPDVNMDSSRWDALNMPPVAPKPAEGREKTLLVLGQVPNDSQHHMGALTMSLWLQEQSLPFRRKNWLVNYRPHPKIRTACAEKWADLISDGKKPLAEDMATAGAVLTYNSTAGLEAIMAGIPVTCSPTAHYAHVASYGGGECTREQVMQHLYRLAWSQWNCAEIESGEALRFMARHAGFNV